MNSRTMIALILAVLFLLCAGAAVAENDEAIVPLNPGDTVFFGHYEQDNDTANGSEPIEWLILDIQDGEALLISRYILDIQSYHLSLKDVFLFTAITWENCGLRTWLNTDFLNAAFSDAELGAILLTDVDNSKAQNPGWSMAGWSMAGGSSTQDYVFLLSYAEACKYFPSDPARMCVPTSYAIKGSENALLIASERDDSQDGMPSFWWWLRSPGMDNHYAVLVWNDGSIIYLPTATPTIGIRPVIRVSIDSLD